MSVSIHLCIYNTFCLHLHFSLSTYVSLKDKFQKHRIGFIYFNTISFPRPDQDTLLRNESIWKVAQQLSNNPDLFRSCCTHVKTILWYNIQNCGQHDSSIGQSSADLCSVVGRACAIKYIKIHVPRVYGIYIIMASEIEHTLQISHCIITKVMHQQESGKRLIN